MIKLGFASVIGLFIYGQMAPPEMPLSGWAHLPAVGLLGFLLYWIVVKQQPKERDEAREHTERVVDKVGQQFADAQKQQHEDQVVMAESVSKLTEKCVLHLQSCAKHLETIRDSDVDLKPPRREVKGK